MSGEYGLFGQIRVIKGIYLISISINFVCELGHIMTDMTS